MDKQAEPIRLALKSRSDLLKHYHNAKLPQLYARFCFVEPDFDNIYTDQGPSLYGAPPRLFRITGSLRRYKY